MLPRYANSSHNGCKGEAMFFEEIFQPILKGQPFHNLFSLLFKLGSLPYSLVFPLGIFSNFFTSVVTYKGFFIFVICNPLVLLFGLLKLFKFFILLLDFSIFNLNPFKRVES